MIGGVLAFDYGGTLAGPSPRVTGTGLMGIARAKYGDLLPEDAGPAWDAALAVERRVERETGRQRPLSTIVSSLLGRYGIVDDGAGLVDALFDSIGDGEPLPDALSVLRCARDAGFDSVIASNTYRPQRVRERTLREGGLLPYVRSVLLSSELGVRKPHPEFFSHVIGAAGIAAQRIVFIGDTLEKDVLAPLAAGMSAIWVADRQPAREIADHRFLGRVSHLHEIAALLQRWRSHAA